MSKPNQLRNQLVSALEVNSSRAALIVHSVDESGNYVSPGAGSTQVSIKEIQTSSGASVMDSTNNAIGVTIRAGSAAGTEYTDGDVDASISGQAILFDNSSNTLRPVTLSRGLPVNVVAGSAASTEVTIRQSTYTDLNGLFRIADRDASTNVANVTNTTPASTAYAVAVREVAHSTTVQVSSVAGVVVVNLRDGSGNALESAVTTPSTTARGLIVRPVVNGVQSTTVLITSTNSTALYDLISSVAGARQKVYAYMVTSTHTVPSTLFFVSSNAIDRWHVGFGSGSSGITGANMAVTPPGWIFHTDVANALRVRIEGGSSAASTVIARVSISWFSEA